MKIRYWVGSKYESDIKHTDYFHGSITYYGSNENHNIAFCAKDVRISTNKKKDYLLFLHDSILHLAKKHKDVEFVFYDQLYAHEIIRMSRNAQHCITCLNQGHTLETLNNKAYMRLWYSNIVDVPPYRLLSKDSCTYDAISCCFPAHSKFVIQENYSSGGKGTYLLDSHNSADIQIALSESELYLVSPYIENSYSVNLHVCVMDSQNIIFPASIQIIRNRDNKLLYCGADYVEAKRIPRNLLGLLNRLANKIAHQASTIGYRGVMGIDFLVTKDNVMFVDLNPRFQSSTLPLSKSLVENGHKSIYELHAEAFCSQNSINIFDYTTELNVPYSLVQYRNITTREYYSQLFARLKHVNYCEVYADEYKATMMPDYFSMLYRVLFQTNISHINMDNKVNVVESLFDNELFVLPICNIDDLVSLKFALIVQGVRLSEDAKDYVSKKRAIKDATFNAVDMKIFQHLVVNCPVNIPFVELSPFHIEFDKLNGLRLYFDKSFISRVTIDVEEAVLNELTSNDTPFFKIGFRTNDRVRIKHTSVCDYKLKGLSCSFCQSKHIDPINMPLNIIYEVIEGYEKNENFNHYLIGGASGPEASEQDRIKEIIKYIRSISNKPIYLMSLPPKDTSHIKDYHAFGLNEIAFNLEVYNRQIAEKIMPGKGKIPLSQYLNAFKESTKHFGVTGNVRSMLIVGLEPKECLLEGINKLCSIGVAPMLSVLRPMPLTTFRSSIPYNIFELKILYDEANAICSRHNLRLGPACPFCQNNTLSISENFLSLFTEE